MRIGGTINSPDMVVFTSNSTFTLFLNVVGIDPGHSMWLNRYITNWQGWQGLGGILGDALRVLTLPSV